MFIYTTIEVLWNLSNGNQPQSDGKAHFSNNARFDFKTIASSPSHCILWNRFTFWWLQTYVSRLGALSKEGTKLGYYSNIFWKTYNTYLVGAFFFKDLRHD
jgi:hypothetical protein